MPDTAHHQIHVDGAMYDAPSQKLPLAGNHSNSARRFTGYRPGIDPGLAPWSQILGQVADRFGLPLYPQTELRAALATFEQEEGRAADPASSEDWARVYGLLVAGVTS